MSEELKPCPRCRKDVLARSQKGLIAIIDVLKDAARKALEGVENVEKDS